MPSPVPTIDDYPTLRADIRRAVEIALAEDIGGGDITAALIPARQIARATLITREACVVCGIAWFDEVFAQLGGQVTLHWEVKEGDYVAANTLLCELTGNARALLTGERTALNFLQLLSGTATTSRQYAALASNSSVQILDTRKTIPGLRTAQKYAVRCGGCFNHRMGLYDAFLIKENHIAACGGITQAIATARAQHPGRTVEVEVENLGELQEAIAASADIIMLDNFSAADQAAAATLKAGTVKYEISGNLDVGNLQGQQLQGIDFASSGSLTKHVRAIDLSLRLKFRGEYT